MPDGCQYPDLIQSVLLFPFIQFVQFDLFESILFLVGDSRYLVNCAVGSFP